MALPARAPGQRWEAPPNRYGNIPPNTGFADRELPITGKESGKWAVYIELISSGRIAAKDIKKIVRRIARERGWTTKEVKVWATGS